VALLLATASRYGFHRDELYFIVAGRRLDWGYVDQPPLTPLLARLSELAAGTSPWAIRILPALAVGAVGFLTAAIARRLGGGRRAQVFAAFAGSWSGVVLGEGHLLSTATFDYLLWTIALWMLVHLLDGADSRWWLGFGTVIGVGMQNKYTIGFLAVAVVAGLLATSKRRLLATPQPWIGAAIALLIALPNLIWQASNGWPQFELAEALQARSDGPVAFVLYQPLLLSITLAIPAAAGLWRLFRNAGLRPWQPIAVAYVLLFVLFMATGGKAYYLAPMNSALLAAGALWFEGLVDWRRQTMTAAAAVGVAIGVLIALPVLPQGTFERFDATGELRETLGWSEMVDQVAAIHAQLPAAERDRTAIITASYGEAGAIDILGRAAGLPEAVSGHNNYHLWGPPGEHGPIIAIGPLADVIARICPTVDLVDRLSNPWDVDNEEFGTPILLCPSPRGQLADIWAQVRHYN
jgi:4-amino-4-deoxy-L-arabinose transferase-like glycosyltransferase